MKLTPKSNDILYKITNQTRLSDLRNIAGNIKSDHKIATELWSTKQFLPRLLAILIMEIKFLSGEQIDELELDIRNHEYYERIQLIDWLLANQLSKDKTIISLIESWDNSTSVLKRRVYWYHQARLRLMGKTELTNTDSLLNSIETKISNEKPEVQWAMNYTAGQIGKWQEQYRTRCIDIGVKTGLYRDDLVPNGCIPSYLPQYISIEVANLNR